MSRRPAAALGVVVTLAVLALVWAAWGGGDGSQASDGGRPGGRDAPRPRLARGHVPAAGRSRARIQIPSIGVDAGVVDLALNRDKTLQVPARASQVGLWKGGAAPGSRGPAIMVGHVDSRSGPAVFFGLRRLREGDRVIVRVPGRPSARYVVQGSEQVSKNRFPTRRVYSPTRGATLRLITCSGSFDRASGHYRDNLVVYARAAAG